MKNIQVFNEDDYKIFDKLATGDPKKRGPIGWVQVYFDSIMNNNGTLKSGNLHHEGNNLVVAQGRHFVAQKIFNVAGTNDYRAYTISHFSVGAGGATVSGDTVTLLGPFICDTTLESPIRLSGSYLNEPSGTIGDPSTVYSYEGATKPITTDGAIILESESYSGGATTCDYDTKVKCTCVVPAGEPAGLSPGQSVPVNEAGLYFTSGSVTKQFARICFAPKWKEYESTLTIIWYILC